MPLANKVPATILLDDSGPVNLMSTQDPQPWRVRNIPISFLERFIGLIHETGMRGKFTLMPYPNCLGRIDQQIPGYPQKDLDRFLDLTRTEIAPLWDITPEILTHWDTLDLDSGKFLPIREDHWAATQNAASLTDYLGFALQVLKNTGIPANGITSPYHFGIEVENAYAEAVGNALKAVYGIDQAWYFLHFSHLFEDTHPRLMITDAKSKTGVVSIIGSTQDDFWGAQYGRTAEESRQRIQPALDQFLSENGKTGRAAWLVAAGQPVVILTHWQSLFCEGNAGGLDALEDTVKRINACFSDQIYWTTPSAMARDLLESAVSK